MLAGVDDSDEVPGNFLMRRGQAIEFVLLGVLLSVWLLHSCF